MFLYKDIADHTVLSIKLAGGCPIVAATFPMSLREKERKKDTVNCDSQPRVYRCDLRRPLNHYKNLKQT